MKVLKWIGIVLGVLILLVVVAVLVISGIGSNKLRAGVYDEIQAPAVTVPADAESIERGDHIVEAISGCVGCHGENLGGQVFIEEPSFAVVYASNLTPGEGGVGASYTDTDWVRAIRHGIGGDGRGLLFMPSAELSFMSDEDLGAAIAYLKTLPPVNNQVPERTFGLPAKIFVGLGALPLMPDLIDHDMARSAPPAGPTVAYGEYLSHIGGCRDCHGQNLAGQTDPNAPQGVNITPGGELVGWTEADFITAIRTGVKPSGTVMSEEMPWIEYKNMTDEELMAIWAYLSSLDALPTNPQQQ